MSRTSPIPQVLLHALTAFFLAGSFLSTFAGEADVGKTKQKRILPRTKSAAIILTSVKPSCDSEQQSSGFLLRYGLTQQDLEAVRAGVHNVKQLVPFREIRREARHGSRTARVALVGTTPAAVDVVHLPMTRGRFFGRREARTRNNVCVIRESLANALFPGRNPIGRNLRIGNDYYLIMGVARAAKRLAKTARSSDDAVAAEVYVPLSTMRARISKQEFTRCAGTFSVSEFEASRVVVTVRSAEDIRDTAESIETLLRARHKRKDYAIDITPGPTSR